MSRAQKEWRIHGLLIYLCLFGLFIMICVVGANTPGGRFFPYSETCIESREGKEVVKIIQTDIDSLLLNYTGYNGCQQINSTIFVCAYTESVCARYALTREAEE